MPFILRFWTRLRLEGHDYLETPGPLILVSNHIDNWDTYIVGMQLRGRTVHYLARADGMRSRWLGRYWRRLSAIPADREGLTQALRILRAGGAVGVCPEGVIAPAMVRAIPGSAVLALRSGARVIPAAIWGSEQIRPWSFLRRPRVTVRYGPPRLIERQGRDTQQIVDDLMREVAGLLPPEYRGVYGDTGFAVDPDAEGVDGPRLRRVSGAR